MNHKTDALYREIYAYLLEGITELRFKPGDRIVQQDVARKFKSSHTPVRSAISQLIDEGWLSQSPGKSAEVKKPEQDDFVSLYALRSQISKYAAIQASERMTDEQFQRLELLSKKADQAALSQDIREKVNAEIEFHEYIVSCSGNPYFSMISKNIASRRKFYMGCMADAFSFCYSSVDQLPSTHLLLVNNIRLMHATGNAQPLGLVIEHHFSLYPPLDWSKGSPKKHRKSISSVDPLLQQQLDNPGAAGPVVDVRRFKQKYEKNPFAQINKVIYEQLLESIMTGRIKYNDPILINEIAEALNVSRTPVADAVKELVRDGYLSYSNSRGKYICRLSDDEIENIFFARMSLEAAGAALAAQNASPDERKDIRRFVDCLGAAVAQQQVNDCVVYDSAFHSAIIHASHSPYIIEAYRCIYPRIRIWVWQAARILEYKQETWDLVWREHEAIARAIYRKNYDDAKETMRSHLLDLMKKDGKKSNKFFFGIKF